MKKMQSYTKVVLSFLILGHTIFMLSCGGYAGGAPLGPSTNVFPPNEDVIGDWDLEAVVTQSDCDEIPVGSTERASMTVSKDSCEFNNEDVTGVILLEKCQASFDNVVVNSDLSVSFSGCNYVYEENVQLKYDPGTDTLTGTMTTVTTLTGGCEGEAVNVTCHVSRVVTSIP